MFMNGSILITGSRDVEREVARALFEQHLSPFVPQDRTWLVGTSHGIDQWAMEWSTSLRSRRQHRSWGEANIDGGRNPRDDDANRTEPARAGDQISERLCTKST